MEPWLAGAIPKAPDVKVNVCNTILLIFTQTLAHSSSCKIHELNSKFIQSINKIKILFKKLIMGPSGKIVKYCLNLI